MMPELAILAMVVAAWAVLWAVFGRRVGAGAASSPLPLRAGQVFADERPGPGWLDITIADDVQRRWLRAYDENPEPTRPKPPALKPGEVIVRLPDGRLQRGMMRSYDVAESVGEASSIRLDAVLVDNNGRILDGATRTPEDVVEEPEQVSWTDGANANKLRQRTPLPADVKGPPMRLIEGMRVPPSPRETCPVGPPA